VELAAHKCVMAVTYLYLVEELVLPQHHGFVQ
jgi:hypothetical protein